MLRSVIVYILAVCVVAYGVPVVKKRSLYPVGSLEPRPLVIKSYPAIDDFQSDLYEVYAQPYPYVSILEKLERYSFLSMSTIIRASNLMQKGIAKYAVRNNSFGYCVKKYLKFAENYRIGTFIMNNFKWV